MSDFESFSRHLVPSRHEPRVTLQKRGAISLNASAYRMLGAPAAVELLYDRARRVIGLRPVDREAGNAYPVRPATSASGPFVVSAMAFTRYYEIDTTVTRRWPVYLEDGVLCIDLRSETGSTPTPSATPTSATPASRKR